jgi:cytochrome c oxidase subunit 3
LCAICVFSLLFIFGQFTVWQQLTQGGFYIYSNPANSYFYLLTGVHGLHLLGGLFVFARVIWLFSQNLNHEKLVASLKLCALYWHYLFLIWLFLFALLTSSAQTFKTIALFCGF